MNCPCENLICPSPRQKTLAAYLLITFSMLDNAALNYFSSDEH